MELKKILENRDGRNSEDFSFNDIPLHLQDANVIPSLPPEAFPDPSSGQEAGQWIDEYIKHSLNVAPMTPALFHQGAALFLASIAIARRLVLRMSFGNVYPNLFILWLAETTLFRKTTAFNVARSLARNTFPFLLASQEVTPESFLSDLAGAEPQHFEKMSPLEQDLWKMERNYAGQRGWFLDEISGLHASAGRDYNLGLIESLLRFYDCDPHYTRSTRGQGRLTVYNSYLSLLGASTPAAMARHLNADRLWTMGWWPRFAILTPEIDRPEWMEPKEFLEDLSITNTLNSLFNRLPPATWPNQPEALSVALGKSVFESWNRYNRALSYDLLTPDLDTRLFGTYGRLPTHALKVATILAALDWPTDHPPLIELPHLARAISITEEWRRSVHRAIALSEDNAFSKLKKRILYQISKYEPEGASIRDICQGIKDKKPSEIEIAVFEMITASYLEEIEPESGKPGRPTKRYRQVRE